MSYDEEYWFDKTIRYSCDNCYRFIEENEDIISFNKGEYIFCCKKCMDKCFNIKNTKLTPAYVEKYNIGCDIELIERTKQERLEFEKRLEYLRDRGKC